MNAVRCPACGAANAAGAQWCGQCLTRFDASAISEPAAQPTLVVDATHAPDPSPMLEPQSQPAAPALSVVRSDPAAPVRKEGDAIVWRCPSCETDNPIDRPVCSVCGTQMTAMFAEPKRTMKRQGNNAVLYSAMWPGAGHAWAGRTGDAIARIVLFAWTAGVGVLLVTRPAKRSAAVFHGVGWVFLICAVAVWLVSFLEGQRLSRGDATPIIPSKVFLWGMVGLILLLFVSLFAGSQVR